MLVGAGSHFPGRFVFACQAVPGCYLTINVSNEELPRLSTLALRQRQARLWRALELSPELLHGSFGERFLKCGRANCHCAEGQKHGPFFYLSRRLPRGGMRTLLLKGQPQIRQARRGVEAYQAALQLLEQLSELNWELLRRNETPPDASA